MGLLRRPPPSVARLLAMTMEWIPAFAGMTEAGDDRDGGNDKGFKPYYMAHTKIQTLALLDNSYKGSNWSQWCCPPSPFNTKTKVGLRRDILLSTCCNSCEAIPELSSLNGEAEWWRWRDSNPRAQISDQKPLHVYPNL